MVGGGEHSLEMLALTAWERQCFEDKYHQGSMTHLSEVKN